VIRFLLGFVSGLAAAWAALAIWQRVPEFGPVDAIDERAIVPTSELVSSDPPDRPLSYEEAIAMRGRGAWPPPPVTDLSAWKKADTERLLRARGLKWW
jgi:hypothetical protein